MRFPALLPVLAFAVSGCFLGLGDCSYQHRTIELEGTLSATPGAVGNQSVDVLVMLNETRNADPDVRILNITLTGPLIGSPASAKLLDASTEPAMVLADWTQGNAQALFWDASLDLTGPAPSHEMLASLARAGKLRVAVLFGSSAAGGSVAAALAVKTDGNWMHPRCD